MNSRVSYIAYVALQYREYFGLHTVLTADFSVVFIHVPFVFKVPS